MRSGQWLVAFVLVLALASGCGSTSADPKAEPAPPKETVDLSTPEGKLLEQMRGGAVQLQLAQDAVVEAYAATNALKNEPDFGPDVGNALQDLEGMLDSVGATLSELLATPSLAQVEQDFAGSDELRLKAIDGANDAHFELQDCRGLIESVLDQTGEHLRPRVEAIFENIRTAQTEIEAAVHTLGGEIAPPGADS